MRPVGSPENPVRRRGDERFGERERVREGRSQRGHALRPADLDPGVLALHELEQRLERLLLHSVGRLRPAHVIDHHRDGDGAEQLLQLDDVLALEMHDQVPAERPDALHGAAHEPGIGPALQVLHEIEAHAANSALVQALELAVGAALLDDRGAAVAPARARDRVERRAHVRAVAGRVHDHRALEAEDPVQLPHLLDRRIGRPVGRFRRVGKFRRRSEHVAVRVAGVRRRGEPGLLRVRIGGRSGFRRHGCYFRSELVIAAQTRAGVQGRSR